MSVYNVVIVGVGGQGVLFLSETLGRAAMDASLDVKVAEIHGMAQRGGSVISTVRFGKKVHSPTVAEGEADIIIALEPIEALRNLAYANPETLITMSSNQIPPPGVHLSNEKYPDFNNIINDLRKCTKKVLVIDTLELAVEAGNAAAQNTVMLGLVAATGRLPIDAQLIRNTVVGSTQAKLQQVNLKAFDLGFRSYDLMKRSLA